MLNRVIAHWLAAVPAVAHGHASCSAVALPVCVSPQILPHFRSDFLWFPLVYFPGVHYGELCRSSLCVRLTYLTARKVPARLASYGGGSYPWGIGAADAAAGVCP